MTVSEALKMSCPTMRQSRAMFSRSWRIASRYVFVFGICMGGRPGLSVKVANASENDCSQLLLLIFIIAPLFGSSFHLMPVQRRIVWHRRGKSVKRHGKWDVAGYVEDIQKFRSSGVQNEPLASVPLCHRERKTSFQFSEKENLRNSNPLVLF